MKTRYLRLVKKQRGFTLIELLAVILILGIIALIAIPTVSNMVKTSREESAKISATTYINKVEETVIKNALTNDETLFITGGRYTMDELSNLGVDIKGDIEDAIIWIKDDGNVKYAKFCINNNSIYYDGENATIIDYDDYCNGNLNKPGNMMINSTIGRDKSKSNEIIDFDDINIIKTIYKSENEYRFDTYYRDVLEIYFVDYIDLSNAITLVNGNNYWDLSYDQNNSIKGWLEPTRGEFVYSDNGQDFLSKTIDGYKLYIGSEERIYAPVNSSGLFIYMSYVNKIVFDNYDTRMVKNMNYMFSSTGFAAKNLKIEKMSKFDTSEVLLMKNMFSFTGTNSNSIDLGNLSRWDTSNVIDMSYMFDVYGGQLDKFYIEGLSNWDVSNVKYMNNMFTSCAMYATTWSAGNLSKWDTSNVLDMSEMFYSAAKNAKTFNIGDLGNWNVSNVSNMFRMFDNTGYNLSSFYLGDLSNWDVSNVTNMAHMFRCAGRNSKTFNIGDISKWNTSGVINMESMFQAAGRYASYNLDLSNWNINSVTNHADFNKYVESKVIAPTWVN